MQKEEDRSSHTQIPIVSPIPIPLRRKFSEEKFVVDYKSLKFADYINTELEQEMCNQYGDFNQENLILELNLAMNLLQDVYSRICKVRLDMNNPEEVKNNKFLSTLKDHMQKVDFMIDEYLLYPMMINRKLKLIKFNLLADNKYNDTNNLVSEIPVNENIIVRKVVEKQNPIEENNQVDKYFENPNIQEESIQLKEMVQSPKKENVEIQKFEENVDFEKFEEPKVEKFEIQNLPVAENPIIKEKSEIPKTENIQIQYPIIENFENKENIGISPIHEINPPNLEAEVLVLEENINQEILNKILQENSLMEKNLLNLKNNANKPSFNLGIINTLTVYVKFIKILSKNILNFLDLTFKSKSLTDMHLVYHNFFILKNINPIIALISTKSEDDLFNHPEDSEVWMDLKGVLQRREYFNRDHMSNTLTKIENKIKSATAAISRTWNEKSSETFNVMDTMLKMGFFSFFRKPVIIDEIIKSELNPNKTLLIKLWNFVEHKLLLHFSKISYTRIKMSKKVYVKRLYQEIELNFLYNLREKIKNNSEELFYDRKTTTDSSHYHYNASVIDEDLYTKEIKDPLMKKNFVKIRLLSPERLKIPNLSGKHSFWGYFNFLTPSSYIKYPGSLIIHIHGGGFVSLSAASHEIYTRKFAKRIGCHLISLDYRLAPEFSYPNQLDDVFQSYMWIVNHAEEEFKFKPFRKIILFGESSGGSLALSLTYLLILLGKRLPDAIVLAYPGVLYDLDSEITTSFLNYFDNSILHYNQMKIINECYRGEYKDSDDPFLSPLLMDERVLKMIPPIRVVHGSMDPHRDMMLKFISRIK
jgi:hormone-sensitive lipase